MKTIVDNYRGWDIHFDTGNENFSCHSDQYDHATTKRSYTSCKTYIDDFMKDNAKFTPFWVEGVPDGYKDSKLKIIGIRKDGRFVCEDEKGVKGQVSDYDLGSYMLVKDSNKPLWKELKENSVAEKKIMVERNEIYARFDQVTLIDLKKKYIDLVK
jgi:hypothetical protein